VVQKLRLFQQVGVPAPDDPSVVTLSDSFPVVPPQWQLAELLSDAESHNPDLNSLRAQESAARWNERAAKSSWFPSLSFSAGWSGFTRQYRNADFLVNQAQAEALLSTQACQDQNVVNNDINNRLGTSLTIANCSQYQFTP